MNAIKSSNANLSQLGHVFEDIQVLISRLSWAEVEWLKWSANSVAHNLAHYAKKHFRLGCIWFKSVGFGEIFCTTPIGCSFTLCLTAPHVWKIKTNLHKVRLIKPFFIKFQPKEDNSKPVTRLITFQIKYTIIEYQVSIIEYQVSIII